MTKNDFAKKKHFTVYIFLFLFFIFLVKRLLVLIPQYLLLKGLCICLYLSQFYNRIFSDCNFRSNFGFHRPWSFVGFNRERNWIFVEVSYIREVC